MLLVVPLASVNAQTMNEGIDYCQILQTDDCQILVKSTDAMSTVSSFAFDMALAYDIAVEGNTQGMDDLSFGLNGNGRLALDVEYFQGIQDLAVSDPSAYLKQLPEMMDGIFSGFEGEANFTVALPDMFGEMMGTTEIPLNLMMKNGVYVVDVASVEEAVGEKPSGLGWAGIDLNGAFASLLGELDLSSLYDSNMLESMMQVNTTEGLKNVMTITRLADSNVNDKSTSVFEMVFDYGAFLTMGDMRQTLVSMYQNMGMDQDMIDATLSMLGEMKIVFREYIGLQDFYTYRMEMGMDFNLDGKMMGGSSAESMSFGINMSIDLSEFNTPVDIQIPEDAMITPFEMLMGNGM
jgi:hypothetical protein